MQGARSLIAALVGTFVLLCALAPVRGADGGTTERSGSWWSLWSWIDDLFGLSLGGVTYGSDEAGRIIGSDRLVHSVRAISGAHRIELRGPIELVIKQMAEDKLTLHTDDNIAPLVETSVDNGVLRIALRAGASFRSRHAIGATVELARLDALSVQGPGDATCADLDANSLEIALNGPGEVHFESLHSAALTVRSQGSGAVRVTGTSPRQDYLLEGSGDVDASELAGRVVTVRASGSGVAQVWAAESLTVDISGTGEVRYRGQPALTSSVHGTGRLIHQ